MNRRIMVSWLFLVSAGLAGLTACAPSGSDAAGGADTAISIGFTPAENADSVETNGKALAESLKRRTNKDIKVYVASSYAAVVEALCHDQISFAWVPPFSFVQAERLCGAVPLLKVARFGSGDYFGGIIVRAESPYRSAADLKGADIAWADVASTSGHIFPKAKLMEQGIDPETFFKRQLFAGGHDKVVIAVLSQQVAAGATWVNDGSCQAGSWNRFFKERAQEIRCIAVTDPIPNDVFVARRSYVISHPAEVKALIDSQVAITKDPAEKALLKNLYGIDDLAPTKSSDFEVVRKAARLTHVWE